jgi:hypothetical protein
VDTNGDQRGILEAGPAEELKGRDVLSGDWEIRRFG